MVGAEFNLFWSTLFNVNVGFSGLELYCDEPEAVFIRDHGTGTNLLGVLELAVALLGEVLVLALPL